MIEQAWNEYRGWAKRARSLQANTDRWNFWGMVALVATGVLGAASGFFGANPTNGLPGWLAQDEYDLGREPISGVADFPHTLGYSTYIQHAVAGVTKPS
jgi:hypothetical protein